MEAHGEQKTASSGLEFHLHPLVLITISDHFMRTKANTNTEAGPATTVMGALLGQQTGRVVDISNCFEISATRTPTGWALDEAFFTRKQEQYKQTFAKLDVMGWYCTGQQPSREHNMVHEWISAVNESPVLLLMDTTVDRAKHKDLPVTLYESELHVLDDAPQTVFALSHFTMQTSEAERIGVNQFAQVLSNSNATPSDQMAAHFTSLLSAVKVLEERIAALHDVLADMMSGKRPYLHTVAREAASLISRLPAMHSSELDHEFYIEYADALLTVYLSSMTKGIQASGDLGEKLSIAYDKGFKRRGF